MFICSRLTATMKMNGSLAMAAINAPEGATTLLIISVLFDPILSDSGPVRMDRRLEHSLGIAAMRPSAGL